MMKKYSILAILILLISFSMADIGWAQKQDSTKVKKSVSIGKIDSSDLKMMSDSTVAILKGKKLKGFVDKNANGIDDRIESAAGKGKQKGKKDRFIDRNGDGICDGRESAFGIKKTLRRRRGGKKF